MKITVSVVIKCFYSTIRHGAESTSRLYKTNYSAQEKKVGLYFENSAHEDKGI